MDNRIIGTPTYPTDDALCRRPGFEKHYAKTLDVCINLARGCGEEIAGRIIGRQFLIRHLPGVGYTLDHSCCCSVVKVLCRAKLSCQRGRPGAVG